MLVVGFPTDTKFLFICGCLLVSVFNQCVISLLPVVMRDFTGPGQQGAQNKLQAATAFGSAAGPIIQLILIAVTGLREWKPPELHWVLFAGAVLFLSPCLPAFWHLQQLHTMHGASENS